MTTTQTDQRRERVQRVADERGGDHGARLRAAVATLEHVCTACTDREERVAVRSLRRAAHQVMNVLVAEGLAAAADARVVAMLDRHVHVRCLEFHAERVTP